MDNYPLLNLFWTMLYLFLWIAWIFLIFRIIGDIFRSRDLGGWAKAGWTLIIFVLPWLGTLIYLVARGGGMHERDLQQAEANREAMARWLAESPGSSSVPAGASAADQLGKLAELRQTGLLTDEEFAAQKAKILARAPARCGVARPGCAAAWAAQGWVPAAVSRRRSSARASSTAARVLRRSSTEASAPVAVSASTAATSADSRSLSRVAAAARSGSGAVDSE